MSIIDFNQVTWRRDNKVIVGQLNWTVEPGQHWVLIGANGSGKTSILNLIAGYSWPTTGTVDILGHRLGRVDLRELRKSIGIVSSSFHQQLQSFRPAEPVVDIVISGKFASIGLYEDVSDADVERALYYLRIFGCLHLADRAFHLLSQGEKQRVLLARAWMAKPSLLILDEPCTGLDITMREQLLDAVEILGKSPDAPTILYVTHYVEEVMPVFTHTLILKEGQVVAAGPKSQVITSEYLTSAFSMPVEVSWSDNRPWLRVKSPNRIKHSS